MPRDAVLVVQETEYTGAGKHPMAQLKLARERGISIQWGNPVQNVPGKTIIIPSSVSDVCSYPVDLDEIRKSYLKNVRKSFPDYQLIDSDYKFLSEDIRWPVSKIKKWLLTNPSMK